MNTHRELSSSRQDVDGVLFLTDAVQTRSFSTSCSSLSSSSSLLSSSVLRLSIGLSFLQSDAQSEIFRQMVHGGVGCRLHEPAEKKNNILMRNDRKELTVNQFNSWTHDSSLTWSGCSPGRGPAVGVV